MTFLKLVERDRQSPVSVPRHLRAVHLNNLAWADLMTGDRSLLPEADAASLEALTIWPKLSSIRGTRGFALVQSGRVDEGLLLTLSAYHKMKEPSGRASDACVIAIASVYAGRTADAYRWLARARRFDPACALLARAEALAQLANANDHTDVAGQHTEDQHLAAPAR